jgi:hypothetical protein
MIHVAQLSINMTAARQRGCEPTGKVDEGEIVVRLPL